MLDERRRTEAVRSYMCTRLLLRSNGRGARFTFQVLVLSAAEKMVSSLLSPLSSLLFAYSTVQWSLLTRQCDTIYLRQNDTLYLMIDSTRQYHVGATSRTRT